MAPRARCHAEASRRRGNNRSWRAKNIYRIKEAPPSNNMRAPTESGRRRRFVISVLVIGLIVRDVFSFTLITSSSASHICTVLWLADADGDVDSEADMLLSEIAELTESFEYVQKKNENNKRLYKERIATLQSQISSRDKELSELKRQLEDAMMSSSPTNSTSTVFNAAPIDADVQDILSQMRNEWEMEKQALLEDREVLVESISSLQRSIHDDAESMRSDIQKEYINLKASAINERDAALRISETVQKELEVERAKRLQLEGEKMSRGLWKRLKNIFRRQKK